MVLLYIVCLAVIAATDLAYATGETCQHPDQVIWGTWCYYAPPTGVFSWEDGDAYCKDYGMELASIHSKEESEYIFEYTEEVRGITNYWFGLIRDGDTFVWTDGTAFDYDNWSKGEPNTRMDMCANLREDGTWNDLTCEGYELAIICRGELSPEDLLAATDCPQEIENCAAFWDETAWLPSVRCENAEAWYYCLLYFDDLGCPDITDPLMAALLETVVCYSTDGGAACQAFQDDCRNKFESKVDIDPELSCSYAGAWISCLTTPEVMYECDADPPADVVQLRDEKCFNFLREL